jgi:hypothetical protein
MAYPHIGELLLSQDRRITPIDQGRRAVLWSPLGGSVSRVKCEDFQTSTPGSPGSSDI